MILYFMQFADKQKRLKMSRTTAGRYEDTDRTGKPKQGSESIQLAQYHIRPGLHRL